MNLPVQNKNELIERLILHRKEIIHFGVTQLGFFGSFVRDEVTQHSDVDLFLDIVPEKKTLENLVALHDYLHELLGRKIEIVTPSSLNKFIGKYITAEVEYVSIAA